MKRLPGAVYVGDLVFPKNDKEFLFSTPDKVEAEEDPIEMVWESTPGIVIELLEFEPQKEYYQVKVVVDTIVGWTCSDYIKVIGKI